MRVNLVVISIRVSMILVCPLSVRAICLRLMVMVRSIVGVVRLRLLGVIIILYVVRFRLVMIARRVCLSHRNRLSGCVSWWFGLGTCVIQMYRSTRAILKGLFAVLMVGRTVR